MSKKPDVVIEDYQVYPAGRGKKLVIAKQKTIFKKQKGKTKPYYWLHFKTRGKEAVTIAEYPKSRPILFPERIHMNTEEITELLASALALYIIKFKFSKKSMKNGTAVPLRIQFPLEVSRRVKGKIEKYEKWKTEKKIPS